MIYLAISDGTRELPIVDSGVSEFISGTRNESLRRSRSIAYSLLCASLGNLFPGEKIEIKKEPSGKPFGVRAGGERLHLSISHTDGLAAVAISDACPVGVDVEAEIIGERRERVEKRFLANLPSPLGIKSSDAIPRPVCYGEGISISGIKEPAAVTDRWVVCEAYLKCDGGGFGSISDIGKIEKDAVCSLWHIEADGRKYSLAMATAERKK